MRSILTLLCLVSAFTARAADGFVPLFNGRNLDGWYNVNCAPETWSVKNGMIHCTGKPIGELRTTRMYENFVLELEWRHLKSGGNAGVFAWSGPIGAQGVPFLRAVEVQVLDHGYIRDSLNKSYTTHGDVFPIHGSKMDPFPPSRGSRSFPSERHGKGSPEWNHYRIECKDGTLWLHVNGHKVSGGENCTWRKGYIALESEGSPVQFRNLRIKELPSTNPAPKDTAPEYEGHRTLYTGTDLRGWTPQPKSRWQSADWQLIHTGGDDEASLSSAESFGNVELIFDCAPKSKGAIAGGVRVRGELIPFSQLAPGGDIPPEVLKKASHGFYRYKIWLRDRMLTVHLNGTRVLVKELPKTEKSRVEFIGGKDDFNLANIYVRELN
ncbi:MAG: 3-keto-disaccharide hydrolase [Limisphaerales bacterium]